METVEELEREEERERERVRESERKEITHHSQESSYLSQTVEERIGPKSRGVHSVVHEILQAILFQCLHENESMRNSIQSLSPIHTPLPSDKALMPVSKL